MAEQLEIPRTTYHYYENQKSVPGIDVLVKAMILTGYSAEYLLGIKHQPGQEKEALAIARGSALTLIAREVSALHELTTNLCQSTK